MRRELGRSSWQHKQSQPKKLTSEWRKPRKSGRGKPGLQRCRLLFDVAFDYGERCAAT